MDTKMIGVIFLAVQTPSEWQVRQPIYRSSVGRWKKYAAYLGPVEDVLAEIIWHMVKNKQAYVTGGPEAWKKAYGTAS